MTLEENVTSILCSGRDLDTVTCKGCMEWQGFRDTLHVSQVKVYRDPLEGKANCDQEVTEQNMFIKLAASEYLSVSDWMVSVTLIVLDRGTFMGRTIASEIHSSTVRHYSSFHLYQATLGC